MPLKFFLVPIHDCGTGEEELNRFLRNHRVLAVDRRWVDQGTSSFWAVCVDYLDEHPGGGNSKSGKSAQRSKVDYKEILSADEFAVFSRLRDLRKEIAQSEAIPVYTVFTNVQLAQMVQQRAKSVDDLSKIEGVGSARVEKYADRILPLLAHLPVPINEADGESI